MEVGGGVVGGEAGGLRLGVGALGLVERDREREPRKEREAREGIETEERREQDEGAESGRKGGAERGETWMQTRSGWRPEAPKSRLRERERERERDRERETERERERERKGEQDEPTGEEQGRRARARARASASQPASHVSCPRGPDTCGSQQERERESGDTEAAGT